MRIKVHNQVKVFL